MKKYLLVGAIALFAAVNAQQTKFGLKAGYASSKLTGDDLDFEGMNASNKSKSGYFVGAFVEYQFTDKVALQGEIQYANLGGQLESKVDETVNGTTIKFTLQDKLNFNQILIPISIKYFATPQLALFAGPSVGFNAGYKSDIRIKDATNFSATDIQDEINDIEKEQDKALKENLKSTSFNVFFGGEYTFYKNLFIDARYTVGLTNYEKEPVDGSSTKMNFFQIGLGYKFMK